MRSRLASGIAALFALALPVRALAADPPNTEAFVEIQPRERPMTTSFYGWQILASGEVGGVLAAGAMMLPDKLIGSWPATAAFLVGMPAYALGGPIVHWTHGHFEKGLVSFAANVAGPLIFGFTGEIIRCNEANAPDDCGSRGFPAGFALALVVVPLVDALVLGWENRPLDDYTTGSGARSVTAERSRAPSVSITPIFGIDVQKTMRLGVGGVF